MGEAMRLDGVEALEIEEGTTALCSGRIALERRGEIGARFARSRDGTASASWKACRIRSAETSEWPSARRQAMRQRGLETGWLRTLE
jgi:hypothetical protein